MSLSRLPSKWLSLSVSLSWQARCLFVVVVSIFDKLVRNINKFHKAFSFFNHFMLNDLCRTNMRLTEICLSFRRILFIDFHLFTNLTKFILNTPFNFPLNFFLNLLHELTVQGKAAFFINFRFVTKRYVTPLLFLVSFNDS